ncbi:hypothetical protein O9992_23090 [Vibrio lentus]|nr:hypothetical protein [Vibrio lentus]
MVEVGEDVIPYETLSKLIELYNDRDSTSNRHLSIERLISGLAVRRKVCKQVHEGHLDENVFLALSTRGDWPLTVSRVIAAEWMI